MKLFGQSCFVNGCLRVVFVIVDSAFIFDLERRKPSTCLFCVCFQFIMEAGQENGSNVTLKRQREPLSDTEDNIVPAAGVLLTPFTTTLRTKSLYLHCANL